MLQRGARTVAKLSEDFEKGGGVGVRSFFTIDLDASKCMLVFLSKNTWNPNFDIKSEKH